MSGFATADTTVLAVGLHGTPPTSFYTNVNGPLVGLLVGLILIIAIIYVVLIKRNDSGILSAVGWILIVLIVIFWGGPALNALSTVAIDTWNLIVAWATGS